jgi:hypothetical protein
VTKGVIRQGKVCRPLFKPLRGQAPASVSELIVAYAQHDRLRATGDGPRVMLDGSGVVVVDESWVNESLD